MFSPHPNIVEVMGSRSTKYGGVERFMVRLVKTNPDLAFHFVYNEYPRCQEYADNLVEAGATIHILNALGKGMVTNLFPFCRLIKLLQPKAVHFHFSPVHAVWGPLCQWMGVPKLYRTAHSLAFNHGKNAERISDMSLHHRILMQWGREFKRYDRNICVSYSVMNQFTKVYGDFGNNEVIYFGTDRAPVVAGEVKERIRKEIEAEDGSKILTTIQFADRIKGCDVLLKALPQVKGDYRLVVIGLDEHNSFTQQMHALAEELGISDHIAWIGLTNQVPQYLSVTDVFIQPSRTEALSLAAIEAMSFGIPVVASNVGGLPEVASSLFEREDSEGLAYCLNTLLNNPTELQRQKTAQYKRWEQTFDIQNGIKAYSALYH